MASATGLGLAFCAALLGSCAGAATQTVAATQAYAATQPRSATVQRFASPYSYEWFVRAELLRAGGQLPAAIEAYRTALAGAEEDSYVAARLGSALAEAGELVRAQRLLDEALALDPEAEAVWLARAALAEQRSDFDGALTALEHAEHCAPLSARAPLQLAALLREHGDPERAGAVLARYRARSLPGGADARRAELEQAIASGDAKAVFEASLPYRLGAPPLAAGQIARAAQLLLERGRPALALRLLELLPEPERDAPLELRALVQVGSVAALEAWLVRHGPSSAAAPADIAQAQLWLGKLDDAAALIAAERTTQPEAPALQLLAADIELAREHYAQAVELFVQVPRSSRFAAAASQGLGRALAALALPALAAELNAAQ